MIPINREALLQRSVRDGQTAFMGPDTVWLDITARCSSRCAAPDCSHRVDSAETTSVHVVEDLISSLDGVGVRRVVLGWRGDPLEHPDLTTVIDLLRQHELRVDLRCCLWTGKLEAAVHHARFCDRLILHSAPEVDPGRLRAFRERIDAASLDRDGPQLVLEYAGGAAATAAALAHAAASDLDEIVLVNSPGAETEHHASRSEFTGRLASLATRMLVQEESRLSPLDVERAAVDSSSAVQLLPVSLDGGFTWDSSRGVFRCSEGHASVEYRCNPEHPNNIFVKMAPDPCERCPRQDCTINRVMDRAELRSTRVEGLHRVRGGRHEQNARTHPCRSVFELAWIDHRGDLWSCPRAGRSLPLCSGADRLDFERSWNDLAVRSWRRSAAASSCVSCHEYHRPEILRSGAASAPLPRGWGLGGDVARMGILALRQREKRQEERRRWTLKEERYTFELRQSFAKLARRDRVIRGFELTYRKTGRVLGWRRQLLKRHQEVMFDPKAARGEGSRARGAPRAPDSFALVIPPPWGKDMPLLGPAYLLEYLRQNGQRVSLWDLNIEVFNATRGSQHNASWASAPSKIPADQPSYPMCLLARFRRETDQYVERLLQSDVSVIGFSVNVRNYSFAREMARMIHREDPRRLVVFGGPEATERFRRSEIDYPAAWYAVGEAEETLLELVSRHCGGDSLTQIQGAARGDRFGDYVPRRPIADLDRLPVPSYDDFDLKLYDSAEHPVLFSRGCFGSCVFCMDRVMNQPFRCRNGERLADEVQLHMKRHDATFFNFGDLICNGDMDQLMGFCHAVVDRRLEICWCSHAMIRPEMTPDHLEGLGRAGCTNLHYGLESGSDEVLYAMGKRHDAALAARVLRDTTRAGIEASINVIVGFPGETEEGFAETCDFIRQNRDNISEVLNVTPLSIMPLSILAEHTEQFGLQAVEEGAWISAGLTEEIRLSRLERMSDFLESLGLPGRRINLPIARG